MPLERKSFALDSVTSAVYRLAISSPLIKELVTVNSRGKTAASAASATNTTATGYRFFTLPPPLLIGVGDTLLGVEQN